MLVVEDERNIRELGLPAPGPRRLVCDAVGDGKEALARTEQERYDLIVLDVMIPELDGLSLCRAVRNGRVNLDVPILILTARPRSPTKSSDSRRRRRLPDEAVRRARAGRPCPCVAAPAAPTRRPRRAAAPPAADLSQPAGEPPMQLIHIRGFEIDPARRRVRIEGRGVELTDQEFRMLHFLATHAGIVFSREALL